MNFLLPILGLLIGVAAIIKHIYLVVQRNKEKKRELDNDRQGTP
jgi:hypothetical protein